MPNLGVDALGCAAERNGCAALARRLGGDQAASSGYMASWLLIEQPGSWPAEAVDVTLAGILDADRLAALRAAGLRPLLVRRPGRHPRTEQSRRTVFVASGRPGNHWLERLELPDLSRLAEVDLEAVAAGRAGHGERVDGPMLLVCTHGSKDMCCAVLGRPLATGLAEDYPENVWEVSHVGGDRWAGNLLVVPDGYLHGQLDPAKGGLVAKAAMSGQVYPDYLRGRTSATSGWAQAAEIALRRHTGFAGADDVLATEVGPGDDPNTRIVAVAAREHRYELVVRRAVTPAPAGGRCTDRLVLTTYPVVDVRRVDPPIGPRVSPGRATGK
jgi:hypothetical protein